MAAGRRKERAFGPLVEDADNAAARIGIGGDPVELVLEVSDGRVLGHRRRRQRVGRGGKVDTEAERRHVAGHEEHAGLLQLAIRRFGQPKDLEGDGGALVVGKSETALELVKRGHRLVADDAVEIRNVSGNILMGAGSNKIIGHHMEIRGIGIINVAHIFGVGAIRDRKQIQLVVALEPWDSSKDYDRIGAQDTTIEILGVQVPYLKLPVRPGRNIPILIETATMNERLKKMGYFSAREFNRNVLKWLESENARTVYFQNTDTY